MSTWARGKIDQSEFGGSRLLASIDTEIVYRGDIFNPIALRGRSIQEAIAVTNVSLVGIPGPTIYFAFEVYCTAPPDDQSAFQVPAPAGQLFLRQSGARAWFDSHEQGQMGGILWDTALPDRIIGYAGSDTYPLFPAPDLGVGPLGTADSDDPGVGSGPAQMMHAIYVLYDSKGQTEAELWYRGGKTIPSELGGEMSPWHGHVNLYQMWLLTDPGAPPPPPPPPSVDGTSTQSGVVRHYPSRAGKAFPA